MDLSSPQNLDPQAVNLAKAIRTTESNGNYNAVGDNGDSHGAYQFNKGNFAHWASQFGLDPNDMSPVNQDKVAYAKIKSWKDQGYNADEISAMWNGSHLENGRPVANNPEYVKKVKANFGALGSNLTSTPATTNASGSGLTNYPSLAPTQATGTPAGVNLPASHQGAVDFINRGPDNTMSIPAGIANAVGGFSSGVLKGMNQLENAPAKGIANIISGGLGTPKANIDQANAQSDASFKPQNASEKAGAVASKIYTGVGGLAAGGAGLEMAFPGLVSETLPNLAQSAYQGSKGLISKLIPKSKVGKIVATVAADAIANNLLSTKQKDTITKAVPLLKYLLEGGG